MKWWRNPSSSRNAYCVSMDCMILSSQLTHNTILQSWTKDAVKRNRIVSQSLSKPQIQGISASWKTKVAPTNCFVNDQSIFDLTFGQQPTMLQITQLFYLNGNNGKWLLYLQYQHCEQKITWLLYIEKCHFDIFVAICHSDYIGLHDPASEQRATQEICKKILKLQQITRQKQSGNKRITLHCTIVSRISCFSP